MRRRKGYLVLLIVCLFYWILDSVWSYLSFEMNLRKLIFSEPTSIIDTILLRVSPYQMVSRIMVLLIFFSLGSLIIFYLKRKQIAEIHQKAAERQNEESLREKETLLQEIHHRVKNNMQVIISLLRLQLVENKNREVETILKENIGRVYAMAAIHGNLYRSEKLSEIDIKAYLQHLTLMLAQTYTTERDRIKIQIDLPDFKLNIDQANPLGLVLNELITNALKYAFPDERKGTITLKATLKSERDIEICVEDDGIGMPAGFDWKTSESLGLKLVKEIVENQLDGSIRYEGTKGTRFTISISKNSLYN